MIKKENCHQTKPQCLISLNRRLQHLHHEKNKKFQCLQNDLLYIFFFWPFCSISFFFSMYFFVIIKLIFISFRKTILLFSKACTAFFLLNVQYIEYWKNLKTSKKLFFVKPAFLPKCYLFKTMYSHYSNKSVGSIIINMLIGVNWYKLTL